MPFEGWRLEELVGVLDSLGSELCFLEDDRWACGWIITASTTSQFCPNPAITSFEGSSCLGSSRLLDSGLELCFPFARFAESRVAALLEPATEKVSKFHHRMTSEYKPVELAPLIELVLRLVSCATDPAEARTAAPFR